MLYRAKLDKKFRHRQKVIEDLRKRFRNEYLETRRIKIGDIVLIGDDTHRRIDWPLARVEDVIVGRDGQKRICVLKTKNGLFKRPIQRIYPLEVTHDEESEHVVKRLRKQASQRISSNKETNCKSDKQQIEERKGDEPKIVTTRSGRIVKKPDRYKS